MYFPGHDSTRDVCLVATPTTGSDEVRPCDAGAVTFVRVPYLMGVSAYVPLCSMHKAEHDRFFAEQRNCRSNRRVTR